jgi:hypothetical protein
MHNVFRQDLLEFLDSYKYNSARLGEDMRLFPSLEKQLREIIDSASQIPEWPQDFRNWRVALFGLLGNEIGGVASPMLRENAAAELFNEAAGYGISVPMLRMVCGEINPLRLRLQGAQIEIPQELEASHT